MTVAAHGAISMLAWLDQDEQAAARLREILRAFEEKSTLDNLGLGLIRDAFSDLLFPGTSTIQTRARYFLFVPWIFRQLETERIGPADFDNRLRMREVELIESLRAAVSREEQGVIGYRARDRTQRLPSSVYWRGLARLGIRLNEFSLPEYRSRLTDLYQRRQPRLRDDDGQPLGPSIRNWDSALPEEPTRFPRAAVNFDLTRLEADYLSERIRMSAAGSLLAVLVDTPGLIAGAKAPWEVEQAALPVALRTLISHASWFSAVMWGAQLVYNLLLVERARSWLGHDYADHEAAIQSMLGEWQGEILIRRPELERWASDRSHFWQAVGRPIPLPTQRFVESWVARSLKDPATVGEDSGLHAEIVQREFVLKGRLARLSNRAALEEWRGQALGSDRLTYRWTQAVRILADIHAARN